jgi:FMN reductase
MTAQALRAVGISGSPNGGRSHSRQLLALALQRLEAGGARTQLIDLAVLPADALLGRGAAAEVVAAQTAVAGADIVVASTPVYRATYSGLLKVFFDLLPREALAGKVAIPIATGGVPGHLLAVDHGLRPLFASVGALTVAAGTYGTDDDFPDGQPSLPLRRRAEQAVAEALALAATLPPSL